MKNTLSCKSFEYITKECKLIKLVEHLAPLLKVWHNFNHNSLDWDQASFCNS